MIVTLTKKDMLLAARAGCRRHIEMIGKSWAYGSKPNGVWDAEIEGAAGELAFCKAMGWDWDESVNVGSRPDCGAVQVKTTDLEDGHLIVRRTDMSDPCVLVIGKCPRFRIAGWMYADEARLRYKPTNPGGKTPAIYVPQDDLWDISILPDVHRECPTHRRQA